MSSKTTKERDSRSRSWFIVCPNIRENGVCGIPPDDIAMMTEQEICEYIVNLWTTKDTKSAACLYCKSAEGMEHLHIVMCSTNPTRFSTIKSFIGDKAHIEMTMGQRSQVEAYINKTGSFAEKGEVILAKFQIGELIGNQGKRTDIEIIREAIDEGKNWKQVQRMNDKFYSSGYERMIKSMYFDKRQMETPFKREVSVHWCCGESGSGKTGIALELVEALGEDEIYLISDYKNGFDMYSGEPVLILDEYRGQMPYATLLGMLEGYKKQIPARYQNVTGLWNDVYITTVKTPEQVYSKMIDSNESEEDPIGQLLTRLKDFTYCYKVNRKSGTKKDRDGNPCEFYRYTISGEMYREIDDSKTDRLSQIKLAAYLNFNKIYRQVGDACEAFKSFDASL